MGESEGLQGMRDWPPGRDDLEYFTALLESRPSGSCVPSWDRRAELWAREGESKGGQRVSSAVAFLTQRGALCPDYAVADIGCGPGKFAAAFGARVRSVVGLDLSERMVAHGREYIRRQGLTNVELRVCDFQMLDVDREGLRKAFDLVFSSLTPAVRGVDGLSKVMEMSRGFCCNVTHLYRHNRLRERMVREVFGREGGQELDGRWFYALFNVLFLMGYCPETGYETRHQERLVRPDGEYVEFVMEHALTPEEQTMENAARVLRWLEKYTDQEGMVREVTDSCYGTVFWDVRRRRG